MNFPHFLVFFFLEATFSFSVLCYSSEDKIVCILVRPIHVTFNKKKNVSQIRLLFSSAKSHFMEIMHVFIEVFFYNNNDKPWKSPRTVHVKPRTFEIFEYVAFFIFHM